MSIVWPSHKAGLFLTQDVHKSSYETIAEYIEVHVTLLKVYDEESFPLEERTKCIATNTIWELCWYPNTPVGSCHVAAATFEKVLELARE